MRFRIRRIPFGTIGARHKLLDQGRIEDIIRFDAGETQGIHV